MAVRKIGAGSGCPFLVPGEGWLMFYHGVINTCNGFRYSMGAAILDENDPTKVLLHRTARLICLPRGSLRTGRRCARRRGVFLRRALR